MQVGNRDSKHRRDEPEETIQVKCQVFLLFLRAQLASCSIAQSTFSL